MKKMSFQIQYISIIITYFVTKMQAFFFLFYYKKLVFYVLFLISFYFFSLHFLFLFLVLNYFLLLLITISLFLLFFNFLSSSFFSLNMHILCLTFGYCTNHPKNQPTFYASNVSIANETNVYFVTLAQVFHIELYVFEVLLMQ